MQKGDLLIIFIYFALYIIIGRVYDGFLMSMRRISEIIYSQSLAFAVCDGILYIIIWLLSKHLPNILPGLMAFCGANIAGGGVGISGQSLVFPDLSALHYGGYLRPAQPDDETD